MKDGLIPHGKTDLGLMEGREKAISNLETMLTKGKRIVGRGYKAILDHGRGNMLELSEKTG